MDISMMNQQYQNNHRSYYDDDEDYDDYEDFFPYRCYGPDHYLNPITSSQNHQRYPSTSYLQNHPSNYRSMYNTSFNEEFEHPKRKFDTAFDDSAEQELPLDDSASEEEQDVEERNEKGQLINTTEDSTVTRRRKRKKTLLSQLSKLQVSEHQLMSGDNRMGVKQDVLEDSYSSDPEISLDFKLPSGNVFSNGLEKSDILDGLMKKQLLSLMSQSTGHFQVSNLHLINNQANTVTAVVPYVSREELIRKLKTQHQSASNGNRSNHNTQDEDPQSTGLNSDLMMDDE